MKKSRKTLTILTPSYNRAHLLRTLYNSLANQTLKDFVWMVLDDGSEDGTKELVSEFINENRIEILYLEKENGGKHKAINYSIPYIKTEMTMLVDSDDYLTDYAVETIIRYHQIYKKNKKLCGYSFLRQFPNGSINNRLFPEDKMIGSYIDCRINLKIVGDKAEVFYTKCLKEFPFPEFENENFINEDVVWIRMGLKYDMVHINEVIYVADYLEDGLTKKGKILKVTNPLGGMERGKMMMVPQCRMSVRIKGALFYIVFGKFAGKKRKELTFVEFGKSFVYLLYPLGLLIFYYFKIKFAVENS